MAGRRAAGAALLLVVAASLGVPAVLGAWPSGGAPAAPDGSAAASLVVRDPDGGVVLRAGLAEGDRVVLRYRNSLYGSLAEERFELRQGALQLVELAADERAVLDEYYAVDSVARVPHGNPRAWRASPREPLALTELAIAATDLGERTLLLPGRPPLELWRHAADERPTVRLTVEPAE